MECPAEGLVRQRGEESSLPYLSCLKSLLACDLTEAPDQELASGRRPACAAEELLRVPADPLSGDNQVLVCQLLAGCARRLLQLGMSWRVSGQLLSKPLPWGGSVLSHLSLCCSNWTGYSTTVWNLV